MLSKTGITQTLAEMRETPGSEDLDEHGAVFAFPTLPSLIEGPCIAINQLVTHYLSSARLWGTQQDYFSTEYKKQNKTKKQNTKNSDRESLC